MKDKSVVIDNITYNIQFKKDPCTDIHGVTNLLLHIFDRLANIEAELKKLKTIKRKKKI